MMMRKMHPRGDSVAGWFKQVGWADSSRDKSQQREGYFCHFGAILEPPQHAKHATMLESAQCDTLCRRLLLADPPVTGHSTHALSFTYASVFCLLLRAAAAAAAAPAAADTTRGSGRVTRQQARAAEAAAAAPAARARRARASPAAEEEAEDIGTDDSNERDAAVIRQMG